jgi:primosomal protein N'
VPKSSIRFTGQTDIIVRLKEHFLSGFSHGVFQKKKYFLLHGMGGIGKTQICLKFIEEMSDQ